MATTATTERTTTATIPAATLDEILLGTAQDRPHEAGLPDLPDGWQHAAIVQRLADAPAERREGLLAMAFGLVALLWAPLGIMAVIAGTERVFLVLSFVLAVVALAPRPTGVATALAGLTERLRPAAERTAEGAGALAGRVRRDTGPAARRLAAWTRRTTERVRREAGPALTRARAMAVEASRSLRTRVNDAAASFKAAGERAGDVSAPSGLSDPLSRWVDGQRTPSSTR